MVAFVLRRKLAVLSVVGATVVAGAFAGPALAPPPPGTLLPDLVADPPERPIVQDHTYPDGSPARLLRFDGFVHNIGPGPLEVRGTDLVGLEYSTSRQYVQFAETPSGEMVPVEPPPGPPQIRFENDDGHNHFHFLEAATYSLWNQDRTAQAAPGQKTGFCLVDSERIETTGPASREYFVGDFCHQNQPNSPDIVMGVSAGWRDVYNRELALQWVDISDTAPGSYWLAAEADTNNAIAEADETNNTRAFADQPSIVPGHLAQPVDAGSLPVGQPSAVTLASETFGSPGTREFRIESLPSGGTLSVGSTTLAVGDEITASSVTYTPDPGFSGSDLFTYSALDQGSPYPRTPPAASATMVVGGDPGGTTVAISGAPATTNIDTSVQLSATVSGAGPDVTWSVDGIVGGGSVVGTISPTGLYQAPESVPPGDAVTVRATSVDTPAAFSEVTIGIVDPGQPPPAPDPASNLIGNPSFEESTAGWGSWAADVTRVPAGDAPDGAYVARVDSDGGGTFTIDDDGQTVGSADPNATYVVRAFVRAASPSSLGKPVSVTIRERSPAGALRSIRGPSVLLTNDYQEVTVTLADPVAGSGIDLYVAQFQVGSGDGFFIDQISLSDGTTALLPDFDVDPASPEVGETVTFTDTSVDSDGFIVSREWDLDGDGAFDDSTGNIVSRSYGSAGDVTVGLRITDDDGNVATTTRAVTVVPAPPPNQDPTASFTVAPTAPETGETVTFTDTSTDADGTIASREWDLDGDGA
ncbi:MAG: lysyl oxidase family protein, partial [Miltoncostaeaceae bacterium]